jgi:pimeloyl-ACP methyl ester carboxylesterase
MNTRINTQAATPGESQRELAAQGREYVTHETRSEGIRISYEESGEGEPALLFLPGWCGSRAAFSRLSARCSAHRRTLTLDWRGHGQSESPGGDFGNAGLVQDALSVIESSGAPSVIPVALSHAGWVALELRRRLGERIPKLVLLDWIIMEPPPPFLEALKGLQSPELWEQTRKLLFSMWLQGADHPDVIRYVREDMASYDFPMWARAGREISSAYAQMGSPLQALASLEPPVPVLHLYSQPDDPGYLAAQESFAAEHSWFSVHRLGAHSHFPIIEVPDELTADIERFVA